MTCKRLKPKHREEQDYWLTFDDLQRTPTEEQRLEFLRFDSHGGEPPTHNPIYVGKMRHGQMGSTYQDSMNDPWGFDAHDIVGLYADRMPPYGLRSLNEWFGEDNVKRWLKQREAGIMHTVMRDPLIRKRVGWYAPGRRLRRLRFRLGQAWKKLRAFAVLDNIHSI